MPATKKPAKKPAPKAVTTKKSPAKKAAAKGATSGSAAARGAHAKRIKDRLHTPISKRRRAVSETELEAVTAGVLLVVAEVATETAEVFAELVTRIERIEARLSR